MRLRCAYRMITRPPGSFCCIQRAEDCVSFNTHIVFRIYVAEDRITNRYIIRTDIESEDIMYVPQIIVFKASHRFHTNCLCSFGV